MNRRFLMPARLLEVFAAALLLASVPLGLAQGATTMLPGARPSPLNAFEAALFGLLDAELDRGFEVAVEISEATSSGGTVTAVVDVEVRRRAEFLNEVALSLMPFQGVCDAIDCLPVRVFGTGEPFGRAGFVDIDMPTADRDRDRSLYWHAMFRPLSVVVELVDQDGRVLRRASRELHGFDYTLPLGVNPASAATGLSGAHAKAVHGPIAASLSMEAIPETIWQSAAIVSATVVPSVVEHQSPGEYLYAVPDFAIGMLLPPADASELFVEPGVLIVEAHSRDQAIQGPEGRSTQWNAATIRRLDRARVITHIDGVPVESLEQLADVVFQYRDVDVALTIWEQSVASFAVTDCRLPRLTRDSRLMVPVVYPIHEALEFSGRPLAPDGYGVFSRVVDLGRMLLSFDCLFPRR